VKSRRLKIRGKFNSRTWEYDPVIKLQGRWLELLGFEVGKVVEVVEVEEDEGEIVIRVRKGEAIN